jgi:hypothetical protein
LKRRRSSGNPSRRTKRKYGFFPGCVAKESCKELFNSTMLLADKLGIELVELTAASCCGASVLNDVEPRRRPRAQRAHLRAGRSARPRRRDHDLLDLHRPHARGQQRAARRPKRGWASQRILGKFGAKYKAR